MRDKLYDSRPSHGGNRGWAARLAGLPSHEIIDFSASINPWGPPASVVRCLQAHLDTIAAYPDPTYPELGAALADFHTVPSDWVLPGNGSAELLTWVCRELASLDQVVVMQPAFGDYSRALSAFSASVYPCSLSLEFNGLPPSPLNSTLGLGGRVSPAIADLEHVLSKLALDFLDQAGRSQGLLLNNPHNPTGTLFSRDSILRCLDQFEWVVIDEAFMDFLPPAQQQSLIDQVADYPHLVILRSLTKFFSLPGLRLGYAIAHPHHLKRWQAWRDPWPVNTLAAVAGITALADTAFQALTWAWMATEQPRLFNGLADLAGLEPFPSCANFFLVRSQIPVPELQLRLLQDHKLLIRDCLSFPELGDRYFRVAVRSQDENDDLLSALRSLVGAHET